MGTQFGAFEKIQTKVLKVRKIGLTLHRYPENNLFTLKKLIPIEDSKRSPEKVIAFFTSKNQLTQLTQLTRKWKSH